MSNLHSQEQRERAHHFDGPIMRIGMDNASVHRIISAYASGAIVTKEEALSQMVVVLAKDWTMEMQRAMDIAVSGLIFKRPE